MVDEWQLTQFTQLSQGGSKVRRPCQSTIVGGACTELCHSDRNLRTAWFEKGDFKIGLLRKNTWWIFIIIGWMYTHFQHTFNFKQPVMWILHLMTLLNHVGCSSSWMQGCQIRIFPWNWANFILLWQVDFLPWVEGLKYCINYIWLKCLWWMLSFVKDSHW